MSGSRAQVQKPWYAHARFSEKRAHQDFPGPDIQVYQSTCRRREEEGSQEDVEEAEVGGYRLGEQQAATRSLPQV